MERHAIARMPLWWPESVFTQRRLDGLNSGDAGIRKRVSREEREVERMPARWKDKLPRTDMDSAEAQADLRRAEAEALQFRAECLKNLSEEDFEPEVRRAVTQ